MYINDSQQICFHKGEFVLINTQIVFWLSFIPIMVINVLIRMKWPNSKWFVQDKSFCIFWTDIIIFPSNISINVLNIVMCNVIIIIFIIIAVYLGVIYIFVLNIAIWTNIQIFSNLVDIFFIVILLYSAFLFPIFLTILIPSGCRIIVFQAIFVWTSSCCCPCICPCIYLLKRAFLSIS